jgi:hypothetical protein
LRTRLKRLAEQYPKYGCPTLPDMLVIEGKSSGLSIALTFQTIPAKLTEKHYDSGI